MGETSCSDIDQGLALRNREQRQRMARMLVLLLLANFAFRANFPKHVALVCLSSKEDRITAIQDELRTSRADACPNPP